MMIRTPRTHLALYMEDVRTHCAVRNGVDFEESLAEYLKEIGCNSVDEFRRITPIDRQIEIEKHVRTVRTPIFKWTADWLDCGLPLVRVSHTTAASFAATTMSEDTASVVREPWATWLVSIPCGSIFDKELLIVVSESQVEGSRKRGIEKYWSAVADLERVRRELEELGETVESSPLQDPAYVVARDARIEKFQERRREVTVHVGASCETSYELSYDASWRSFASGDVSEEVLRHGRRFEKDQPEGGRELYQTDKRLLTCVMRVVFGCCVEFMHRGNVTQLGKRPTRADGARAQPKAWTLQVTKPIKHDVRDAVKRYISGERTSLSVQGVTRGHYRHYWYGPRKTLIKINWIEPFWRGPEDAPIAVRSHLLKGHGGT